jgi:tetratricopeptide (TPR) repeat protein
MLKKIQKAILNYKTLVIIYFIFSTFGFWGCASRNKSLIQRMEPNVINPVSTEISDEIFDKKLPKMTSDEYERLGDTLLSRGKLHIAYLQYERSLQSNPNNLRAEYKKGLALLLGEKSDEAIGQFKIVLEKEPGYALAYEGLGRALFRKKEYDEAEINFQKALKPSGRINALWRSELIMVYCTTI